MSKIRGLVSKIIRFSAVDGPGNRLVIFLQGCNFDCINCHNPHTIGLCNACGLCVKACPAEALRVTAGNPPVPEAESPQGGVPQGGIHYDPSRCVQCDRCIELCPLQSNPRAQWMGAEDVAARLREVLPFISGLTVSGGEATRQAAFVRELFTAIKSDPRLSHLTTFIDSNGSASLATWEALLAVTDGVMVDLKALDPEVHRQLTGVTNETVLETIRFLARHGKLFEVRLLLIPGYNADPDQISAMAETLSVICPDVRLRLIPFRKHGIRPAANELVEPRREQLEAARRILAEKGFREVVIT